TNHPILPVVILSASDDPAIMRTALDLGALGFLPKSSTNEVIIKAIQLVMAGGIYVPPEALSRESGNAKKPEENSYAKDFSISRRQAEVMDLVAQGHPNKIIARRLGVSENIVRGHVSAILKILGVTNRTEATYVITKAQKTNDK
ncbi:MAG: response regulator transcription factor, partial [Rhodospirillaceae bacterium]|nr:response regulator transcription factor [Rhodospirillaceae bacterium]